MKRKLTTTATVETVPGNTLQTLRGVLFRELQDLRNDKVEPQHATAIAKISSCVVSTYRLELDAVIAANNLKDKNLAYADNLARITTPDIETTIEA